VREALSTGPLATESQLRRCKPPMEAQTFERRFPSKIALHLKKVCYNVTLYKNRQRQDCKAFIGLSIGAKVIGGDISFYAKLTHPLAKRRFSICFRS